MKKANKMPASIDFSGGERGKFFGKLSYVNRNPGALKLWVVTFSENSGEYEGELRIKAKEIELINATTFVADGVTVEIDEEIYEIKLAS